MMWHTISKCAMMHISKTIYLCQILMFYTHTNIAPTLVVTRNGYGVNPFIILKYISDYYQFSEKQVISLMVHEMIHYYLAINGIDTRGTHGKDFMKMARKLNKKFGLHITEFIDISKLKRSDDAPLLGYWWSKLIY